MFANNIMFELCQCRAVGSIHEGSSVHRVQPFRSVLVPEIFAGGLIISAVASAFLKCGHASWADKT
jgi:hypothetical protein